MPPSSSGIGEGGWSGGLGAGGSGQTNPTPHEQFCRKLLVLELEEEKDASLMLKPERRAAASVTLEVFAVLLRGMGQQRVALVMLLELELAAP